MSRIAIIATAIALSVAAQPALAQDEQAAWDSIENVHGDAAGFFDLLGILQDAAGNGDQMTIADNAFYPLLVNANGESYNVLEAQDLIDDFDALVYPETLEALINQTADDLIVTSEGVGIGNGAIWITNICVDDACAETQWGILSVNN